MQPFTKSLGRVATLAAALALGAPFAALPASASVAAHGRTLTVRGVVVATDAARHTVVLSAGHAVDTVRFATASPAERLALGTRVRVVAIRLADGTFRELRLRVTGRARASLLHGTVVSDTTSRLLISGGGSVVAVARTGRHANTYGFEPTVGAVVNVGVTIHPRGLDESTISQIGQSSLIGLQGTLVSVNATSLVIAVENGANTTVQIPGSITLPTTIVATNQVELQVAYANGVFTLVTITDDSLAANQAANGVNQNQGGDNVIEVEGNVVSSSASSLIIQPGEGVAAVVFSVPANVSDSAATVGARVDATGVLTGAVLTLSAVHVRQPEGDQGDNSPTTQVKGVVITVTPPSGTLSGSLLVQPGDQGAPVTFSVGSSGVNLSALSAGDRVQATGTFVGGVLTLTSVKVQQSEGEGNQGNGQSNNVTTDGTFVSYVPGLNGADGTLVILPGDQSSAITIAVPSSADLTNFTAGDQVHVVASLQNNVLTLVSIALHD